MWVLRNCCGGGQRHGTDCIRRYLSYGMFPDNICNIVIDGLHPGSYQALIIARFPFVHQTNASPAISHNKHEFLDGPSSRYGLFFNRKNYRKDNFFQNSPDLSVRTFVNGTRSSRSVGLAFKRPSKSLPGNFKFLSFPLKMWYALHPPLCAVNRKRRWTTAQRAGLDSHFLLSFLCCAHSSHDLPRITSPQLNICPRGCVPPDTCQSLLFV